MKSPVGIAGTFLARNGHWSALQPRAIRAGEERPGAAKADGIRVVAQGELHPETVNASFCQDAVLLRDVPH